jgi:CPA2 family monovalent cation:H+ antiporter-2
MHEIEFIQDMAVIMIIVGFVSILFHYLKQPVVLGYIISGVIIGPHTPPFSYIYNEHIIKTFAELGVIFLMFSLGLEFNLRKLSKVGISALVAAFMEIVVMIWVGYKIGLFFHWKNVDALFLGAMLAVSSTTIIVKVLNELNLKKEKFAQFIFGILIIEDLLAIGILALLSGIGTSNSMSLVNLTIIFAKLFLFLVVSLSLGILVVPRLLAYVDKFQSHEILLVTVLGLCFGFCLLVIYLHYSIVLGAFIIGAIIGESRQLATIENLVEPLRDMFSAIFFVAIGLLLNPKIITNYTIPIIIITIAVILGKVITCSLGTFITGHDGRTALRVGMGLAQIGEFSFIIASLGLSLNLTGDFLYPIVVAVSAITTIFTPYLIKISDPLATGIAGIMPERIVYVFRLYTVWLQNIQPKGDPSQLSQIAKKSLFVIFLNLALVTAIFLGFSYFEYNYTLSIWQIKNDKVWKTMIWSFALMISLPFLIAVYHRRKILSILLAGFAVRENAMGRFTHHARKMISELIPVMSMIGFILFLSLLSSSLLPPIELLIIVLITAGVFVGFLWRWFVKLYTRLQASFMKTIQKKDNKN